jgi:uncharacterized protein (TIGR03437 family)
VLPAALATGPARLTGATTSVEVRVDEVSPGLFSVAGTGEGVGLILAVVPAYAGVRVVPASSPLAEAASLLLLYGTGLRGRNVVVLIGGVPAPITTMSDVEGVPGVDMIAVLPGAATQGTGEVLVTVDGRRSNAVLLRNPN